MDFLYIALIYGSVLLALLWSLINCIAIRKIRIKSEEDFEDSPLVNNEQLDMIKMIGERISKGANAFLIREYTIMGIFIVFFSIIVLLVVDVFGQTGDNKFRCYTTVAFIVGSVTSILCGWIGMSIAVAANYRTTYKAIEDIGSAFQVAYRAGCVMGFSSVGLALGILLSLILIYIAIRNPGTKEEYALLMDYIAGYGLGGSAMALFGRVGGGIYTKAADVGADLVGKVENDLNEDSPRNPATIADNVGDNVGDVAGMGSDLFGSFAESTCASLVLISSTYDLMQHEGKIHENYLAFPLLISAAGILACFLTSIVGIYVYRVNTMERIRRALNIQLLLSTFLALGFMVPTVFILPKSWNFKSGTISKTGQNWHCFVCAGMGSISGLLIGFSTDYFTSDSNQPVKDMARACTSGPAINVIYGLALGYLSTIIPVFLIALTILVSISLLGMFGVSLAAIGMLSNLAIGLAIDAYGPISDNAGGIAEMSQIGENVRNITDALDAAGNTTAAVGKGFAIGSAALVSLALYGAFITRGKSGKKHPIRSIEVTDGWIFSMLLIGAMLPYAFSALTMKSVGSAAQEMVEEVRRQFQDEKIVQGEKDPDYERCIQVSTNASLREMIAPGLLVILTPIFFGILFHPALVAGLLPGALLSGVQLAISMSNTGGAWDNCKKFIEGPHYVNANGERKSKGSEEHKAAVIGDTIGDPLKDTSGPSLNILIKLMAVISLVFASGFDQTSWLARAFNIQNK